MKLLFIGDSITDMRRERTEGFRVYSFGNGFVFALEGYLGKNYPGKYEIINRGISGDRIVDIYQRIKVDCWNLSPDVITIMVGTNDVLHDVRDGNGVEIDRYERFYNMLIEDTQKVLPNTKIIVMGSFVTHGSTTDPIYEQISDIRKYAEIAKKVALSHNCTYVSLQPVFDDLTNNMPTSYYLFDGIHPTVVGAHVIAEEWIKEFSKIEGLQNND